MAERKVVSLDWDARHLRVVHAGVKKGAVRILRMVSADVPESVDVTDPESLGGMIREVLANQKIRCKSALVNVPRDQALLTTLKLPLTAPEEMPNVVEFQITKELPFPVSQAVIDYASSDGKEGDVVDVMVGTVRRDVVEYFEKTLAAAGLDADRLGLRPNANLVSLEALYGHRAEQRMIFVDVGPTLTEIDVIEHGAVVFSRAASVTLRSASHADPTSAGESGEPDDQGSAIIQFPQSASSASSPGDQAVRSLLMEVARSIEAYRGGDPNIRFDRIVVGGSTGMEAKLASSLGDRFGASVELYNPAPQFKWPKERGIQAQGFAAALGLVTGSAEDGRLHFDFLNPKKALSKTEQRLKRAPYAAAAALLFVGAGVVFYFQFVAPKKAELAKIKKELKATDKVIDELEEYEEKVLGFVDKFEGEQIIWLDELDRIMARLPHQKEMVLKRIDMNQKNRKVSLPLECKLESQISQFVDRLNAFRLPGSDKPYYEVRPGPTKRISGPYKVSGRVDITILGGGSES